MNINYISIKNHSDDFYDFCQEIGNYAIVSIFVYSFVFEVAGDSAFTIKNLQDVFF